MKIKYFNIVTLLFVIATVLFTACGKSGEKAVITHLPVQMKSKGNWSLWDIKTGAILYEGEFKKAPSVVIEGVFITRNEDGDLFYNKIVKELPLFVRKRAILRPSILPEKKFSTWSLRKVW